MQPNLVAMGQLPCMIMLILLVLFGSAKADFAKDKDQCADQLVGLATCLPYVQGQAKAPTPDCCTGLKLILQKNKLCLCILVKDRNDPNLGFKINATLALSLPDFCHSPANVSDCPSLLHLPPNSPDAKVFEEFANSTKGIITSPATNGKGNGASNGRSAEITSDSGRGKKCLGVEMAWGLFITMVFHFLNNL